MKKEKLKRLPSNLWFYCVFQEILQIRDFIFCLLFFARTDTLLTLSSCVNTNIRSNFMCMFVYAIFNF